MKKVILNRCFGGYGWSKQGVNAVLKKKGCSDLHYFIGSQYTDDAREVNYAEFLSSDDWNWFIRTKPGNPNKELDEVEDAEEAFDTIYESVYSDTGFNRDDEEAILVLEELGSKYCSDSHAYLTVEEYDDEYFLWYIDEYDGRESLDLIPNLTEERVLACTTVPEVLELLKKCDVIRRAR